MRDGDLGAVHPPADRRAAHRLHHTTGAVNTFCQFGYAVGVAVLGEVFRGGLAHTAGHNLVGQLSGGQANTVIARGSELAQLVHRAYAFALDVTFVVAAGFALVAGTAVFVFVRPRPTAPAPAPDQEQSLAAACQNP